MFLSVVCVLLISNGLFEIWFSYWEHRAALIRIQREQADAAAAKIGQIKEIESQIGRTTQLPWSASTLEQRRFDGLRLLRQSAATIELSQLDSSGEEQLRVSRLAMDVAAREQVPVAVRRHLDRRPRSSLDVLSRRTKAISKHSVLGKIRSLCVKSHDALSASIVR
jgi:hypothetical protein